MVIWNWEAVTKRFGLWACLQSSALRGADALRSRLNVLVRALYGVIRQVAGFELERHSPMSAVALSVLGRDFVNCAKAVGTAAVGSPIKIA